MDVKVFGSLLVGIGFSERKEMEKQAWSLGQTVGGGGVEDVAGSN